MYKNIGTYFIMDGTVQPADSYKKLNCDKIIYEVLRVLDGHVLFLDDHMDRLRYSLEQMNISSNVDKVKSDVLKLIEINDIDNMNIKLDVIKDHYRVYFMESNYPNDLLYKEGVITTAVKLERNNPTVKQLDMDYKMKIEHIKGDEFFEVLLINRDNKITEGSRANLIFIKDETLYSAPREEILSGITFSNVLKMSKKHNLKIKFCSVDVSMLSQMEACFLTGTSLGILPIKLIDENKYDSANHHVVLKLMKAYNSQTN